MVASVRPIAGTRPRGKTPRNADLAEDLLLDPKIAEHVMLVDLGRNDWSCLRLRHGQS